MFENFPLFGFAVFGGSYALASLALFLANAAVFEFVTPFDVRKETLVTQNEALAHVIRGQLLGQGIMIASLVYFLGISYEHGVTLERLATSLGEVFAYGAFGIAMFQGGWLVLSKCLPLEKEIVADANVALGKILEAFSVAFAMVLAVSLFSY